MTLNIDSLLPRLRATEAWARGALSQVAGQEPREPMPLSRDPSVAALQNQLTELESPFGSPAAGAAVEMLPLAVPILARAVTALPRGAVRLAKGKKRHGKPAAAQTRQPEPTRDRHTRARLQSVLKELDALQASLQNRQRRDRSAVRAVPLSLPFLAWPARSLADGASRLATAVRQRTSADRRLVRDPVRTGAPRRALPGALDRIRSSVSGGEGTVPAARHLHQGSAVLAGSVLLYSIVEQYRGRGETRAMYTPLVVSALTLATNVNATADRRPATAHVRQAVALTAAGIGLLGAGFHIFKARDRPGHGTSYGAAMPATAGSVIAGLLGAAAEWMRHRPAAVEWPRQACAQEPRRNRPQRSPAAVSGEPLSRPVALGSGDRRNRIG